VESLDRRPCRIIAEHETTMSLAVAAAYSSGSVPASVIEDLDLAIDRAAAALRREQRQDGHFAFDLEADATIPAEYVMLKHFLGETDPVVERKIGVYLRRTQEQHGGWPLLRGGALNVSASVKAYVALRMIGDAADAPHMVLAREAILGHGGAAHSNVFTRTTLALFGMVPWRAVPVMPIEIMNAPSWFPFHIYRISYWARDTLVPLLVLMALKPRGANPLGIDIPELFVTPPGRVRIWPKGTNQVGGWGIIFGALDKVLQAAEPYFPKGKRQSAIDKAVAFVRARLNGEDGLGAIYPAMANTVMMFQVLGLPADHPDVMTARAAVDKLLAIKGEEAFCQPALSPVWDTALSSHALMEAGGVSTAAGRRCLDWLKPLQVLDVKGDWAEEKPDVRPGGWAFQYRNDHYPDLDDTAVVVMAMDRARSRSGDDSFDESIARAREWVVGLQCRNGGWAAFDADNTSYYLNYIPFADHGALLDPPTADVTARVVSMLAQLGETPQTSEALRRGLAYLLREQDREGSWYGRWGVNYVYGTWSVLCAFNAAGIQPDTEAVRRAVAWLLGIQNPDGGWGESDAGYDLGYKGYRPAPSTASQTAWAVIGLMAAGEVESLAVERGIAYLQHSQTDDGFWPEEPFTGTGFPRVFYLRYHGYPKFFPLWALARYRNLKGSNSKTVMVGM